jgi:ketosteroid isomerase-like protein
VGSVLESLSPAERLAFVLHDMFAVPFEEIATIVDRSPATAKKLASRARQRVRGTAPPADPDPNRHRQAVEAFLTAARGGDYTALLAILDPDVVMRIDAGAGAGGGMWTIRGAAAVAGRAGSFQRFTAGHDVEQVLVNGALGLAGMRDGRPISIMGFTVSGGRIAALDIFADPDRVARLDTAGGGSSAEIM